MIISTEVARIAQALLKDSTVSVVEATLQSLTPLKLTPGQLVHGEVMASLPNSRYLVRIANELLRMELPLNLQPGQAVELTYVTDEPRVLFALSRSANSGTPVEISATGRWLNVLSLEGEATAPASPLPRPTVVVPRPTTDGATLAQALRGVVTRSGLFYEAHLADWVRGEHFLVELLREPQGSLSRLAVNLMQEGAAPVASIDGEVAATRQEGASPSVSAESGADTTAPPSRPVAGRVAPAGEQPSASPPTTRVTGEATAGPVPTTTSPAAIPHGDQPSVAPTSQAPSSPPSAPPLAGKPMLPSESSSAAIPLGRNGEGEGGAPRALLAAGGEQTPAAAGVGGSRGLPAPQMAPVSDVAAMVSPAAGSYGGLVAIDHEVEQASVPKPPAGALVPRHDQASPSDRFGGRPLGSPPPSSPGMPMMETPRAGSPLPMASASGVAPSAEATVPAQAGESAVSGAGRPAYDAQPVDVKAPAGRFSDGVLEVFRSSGAMGDALSAKSSGTSGTGTLLPPPDVAAASAAKAGRADGPPPGAREAPQPASNQPWGPSPAANAPSGAVGRPEGKGYTVQPSDTKVPVVVAPGDMSVTVPVTEPHAPGVGRASSVSDRVVVPPPLLGSGGDQGTAAETPLRLGERAGPLVQGLSRDIAPQHQAEPLSRSAAVPAEVLGSSAGGPVAAREPLVSGRAGPGTAPSGVSGIPDGVVEGASPATSGAVSPRTPSTVPTAAGTGSPLSTPLAGPTTAAHLDPAMSLIRAAVAGRLGLVSEMAEAALPSPPGAGASDVVARGGASRETMSSQPHPHTASDGTSRPRTPVLPAAVTDRIEGTASASLAGETAPVERSAGSRHVSPLPPTIVDPQTVPLIREQLVALNTGGVSWLGQLWPGLFMEWKIHEREGQGGDDSGRPWQTELRVIFPGLGTVRAQLRLAAGHVSVHLVAEEGETVLRLEEGREQLSEGMEAAGLRLAGFRVTHVE